MTILGRFFIRARRCPLAHCLALAAVVLFGISFFYAIDQKTVMLSALAKPIITVLLGLPAFAAVMAFIVGSKCRMRYAEP